MVEIPDIVKTKINNFIALLEKNNFHIQKAILFGSYARGNSDKWSDIDLAIVSDDFIGDRFKDKMSMVDFIYKSGWDISPLPFRKEDFDESMFVRDEIIRNGIVIRG